jgi:hypothetical protein
MIYLHFDSVNPWHNEHRWPWRTLYQGGWRVSKNKTLEICVDYYPIALAHANLDTRLQGRDHAGFEISFGILGLGVQLSLPDRRHWDYKTNTWAKHD